jgi:hypothetical protein
MTNEKHVTTNHKHESISKQHLHASTPKRYTTITNNNTLKKLADPFFSKRSKARRGIGSCTVIKEKAARDDTT